MFSSHKMLPLADTHTVWVQIVFLDDFGSNLKPARDMGMVTILVRDTDTALRELEKVTGTQVTWVWVGSGFLTSLCGVGEGSEEATVLPGCSVSDSGAEGVHRLWFR